MEVSSLQSPTQIHSFSRIQRAQYLIIKAGKKRYHDIDGKTMLTIKAVLVLIYAAKLKYPKISLTWESWGTNTYKVSWTWRKAGPEFIYIITPKAVYNWRLK